MNAAASTATNTMARLSAWWRRGEDDASPAPAERHPASRPDPRHMPHAVYERVGEFLFANHLSLSPQNFAFAQAFVRGDRPLLVDAVRSRLATGARLDDAAAEQIWEECGGALQPTMLSQLAQQLEERVAECMSVIGDSAASTAAYSTALDREVGTVAADPTRAVQRIVALTLDVASTTRRAGERLQRAQEETRRLRGELETARRVAEQDHLTGLPNRRAFMARLERLHDDPDLGPTVVALCDIDDFKAINDSHGHDVGDRVIRFVGQFLKQELARHAFVARYGGEEFVCLFRTTDTDVAAARLDAVRAKLAARDLRSQQDGAPIGAVTFSAGVTGVTGDAARALRLADQALYVAKRGGKNRIEQVR